MVVGTDVEDVGRKLWQTARGREEKIIKQLEWVMKVNSWSRYSKGERVGSWRREVRGVIIA